MTKNLTTKKALFTQRGGIPFIRISIRLVRIQKEAKNIVSGVKGGPMHMNVVIDRKR